MAVPICLAMVATQAEEPGDFAAMGLSRKPEVLAAAAEATQAMLDRFKAVGGSIAYSYPGKDAPEEAKARERAQRADCRARGKELGAQIPRLEKPGFVLLLGALHNNWHGTFCDGVREALGEGMPLMGGVGKWDDWFSADGTGRGTRLGSFPLRGGRRR